MRYWIDAGLGNDRVSYLQEAPNLTEAYEIARARAYALFKKEQDKTIVAAIGEQELYRYDDLDIHVTEIGLGTITFTVSR